MALLFYASCNGNLGSEAAQRLQQAVHQECFLESLANKGVDVLSPCQAELGCNNLGEVTPLFVDAVQTDVTVLLALRRASDDEMIVSPAVKRFFVNVSALLSKASVNVSLLCRANESFKAASASLVSMAQAALSLAQKKVQLGEMFSQCNF